jgi:hypothetical protein
MRSLWDPWRELAARSHIIFELDPIAQIGGGALYARRGPRAAIIIDPALSRRERRAALAHELVHDERGGVADATDAPPTWAAVVAREERRVDTIVAGRLVPPAELADWLARRSTVGGVSPLDVADEYDVPLGVACLALSRLGPRTPTDPDAVRQH